MIRLSILIVNWNTRELLNECLEAVYRTTQALSPEVIVVDNGSTDGSQELVMRAFPQTRLVQNQQNLGFAPANNQGLALSQGQAILLLNSDAFLQDSVATEMLEWLEAHPHAGIIGPRLIYPDGRQQISHGPLPTLRSELLSLVGLDKIPWVSSFRQPQPATVTQSKPGVPAGMVMGACLMLRRSVLEQIGPLDESFYFFSEEVDFCARAHQVGWQVFFLPWLEVVHVGSGSSGQTAPRVLQLYRAKLQYFKKHLGTGAARQLYKAMRITSIAKALLFAGIGALRPGARLTARLWETVARNLSQLSIKPQ